MNLSDATEVTEVSSSRLTKCVYDELTGSYWVEVPEVDTEDQQSEEAKLAGRFVRAGDWVRLSGKAFDIWLQQQGYSKYDKSSTQLVPQLEQAQLLVQTHRRVGYAGPLAGWRRGVRETERGAILVSREVEPLEPRPPVEMPAAADLWDAEAWGWPTLGKLYEGLLCGVETSEDAEGNVIEDVIDQRVYLFGWWQHFLQSLHGRWWSSDMALALAGQPKSGKTLLKSLIVETAGGMSERPYRYMIGEDNFNGEFLGCPVLEIDDETARTDISSRNRLGAEIKQIVASGGIRARGMHKEARLMKPTLRLVFCLNLESDRLQVLPPIDRDIKDKIMTLKAYRREMPMPVNTVQDRNKFWSTLRYELPCFVWWLLNKYETPEELRGRWSVRYYHHPAIYDRLAEMDPCWQTWGQIERLMQPAHADDFWGLVTDLSPCQAGHRKKYWHREAWVGTAKELRTLLVGDNSPLSRIERNEVRKAEYIGDHLAKLAKEMPGRVLASRTPHGRYWLIFKEEVAL